MGYLKIMILLSRYIFALFAVLFVIVAFSFVKPFISYSLGSKKARIAFLSTCIYFIHILGTLILVAAEENWSVKVQLLINSGIVIGIIWLTLLLLKLMKRSHEIVMWQIMFFLMDIGFLMIQRIDPAAASGQIFAYGLGSVVALIFPTIFSIIIKPQNKYIYMVLLLITAILPMIPGVGTSAYGSRNWVRIAGFSFQPSEIGKVAFVLFLASTLSDGARHLKNYKTLIFPGIITVITLGCLVLEVDLGATLLYYLTAMIMIFVAREDIVLPTIGMGLAGLGGTAAYFLFGHVRTRVKAWINPWANYESGGYQVCNGLFAIGTWGFFGSGLTRGMPQTIPVAVSDYIFPAVCEEFGNLVGIVILLCYLALVLLCLQVAFRYSHAFYRLVIIGIANIFAVQVFIIIGGVLKLIPLTGITVPFMSLGGTSVIVSMGMIGLITYFSYTARTSTE